MAKRNVDEKFMSAFTNLMIDKIKDISEDWQRPWIDANGKIGLPQNLDGRKYQGINSLVLYMTSAKNNYNLPVYTTFNQAKKNGLNINKGSESTPILYWNYLVKDKASGNKLPFDDYRTLSKQEKEKYNVVPYMRHYNVFNIEQTNIREIKPELWDKLEKQFTPEIKRDEKGMFVSEALDDMVKGNSWVVPIYLKEQGDAYYNKTSDYIAIPLKEQFLSGESFYSTMLHEMAHSTGHPERLNREMGSGFGSREYGREELVAELTAAVSAQSIGIATTVRNENAQYLKSWLKTIQEQPDFLFSTMSDVNKASNMVLDVVEKEQLKIYQDREETLAEIKSKERIDTQRITDVHVFKHYTGQYAVQCFIDGKEQQPEILSYSEEKALFKDKSISAIELAQSKYEHSFNENSQSIGMKR